jgi:hypothetical protein
VLSTVLSTGLTTGSSGVDGNVIVGLVGVVVVGSVGEVVVGDVTDVDGAVGLLEDGIVVEVLDVACGAGALLLIVGIGEEVG